MLAIFHMNLHQPAAEPLLCFLHLFQNCALLLYYQIHEDELLQFCLSMYWHFLDCSDDNHGVVLDDDILQYSKLRHS